MNQILEPQKDKLDISLSPLKLLEEIFKKINFSIKGKRKIMFSDIINLIARDNYNGKLYNVILLWCNYNIKQGKDFVLIPEPLN